MDYFARQNVIAPAIGANIEAYRRTRLGVILLNFQRASVKDATYINSGQILRPAFNSRARNVGYEVDSYLQHCFDQHTFFLAGASVFFPGEFIKQTGDSKQSEFFYSQIKYVV